jgi:peptidoglycan/LPS O-acetylase OafA/YrhL
MARRRPPLFLARAPYRRRRLRDAARLLPIVGAFLLFLPILWTPEGRVSLTAGDMVYFFLIWLLLILAAAGFSHGLRSGDGVDEEED